MKKIATLVICALLALSIVPIIAMANAEEIPEHECEWVEHFHYNFLNIYSERYKECTICHARESLRVAENLEFVGDLNGDEIVDILDYAMLKRHVNKTNHITDDVLDTVDMDLNGNINADDVNALKKLVINKEKAMLDFGSVYNDIKEQKTQEYMEELSRIEESQMAEEIEEDKFSIEISEDQITFVFDIEYMSQLLGYDVEEYIPVSSDNYEFLYAANVFGADGYNHGGFSSDADQIEIVDGKVRSVVWIDDGRDYLFAGEYSYIKLTCVISNYYDEEDQLLFRDIRLTIGENIVVHDLR